MSIQYFDALAGAGKTRALVSYAKQLARAGEQVLFAQPSKLLIDNTMLNEIGHAHSAYEVRAIHSGNSSDVVRTIMSELARDTGCRGRIIFITHEAFMHLAYISGRHKWHLLFDETPAVDVFEAINVPESHGIITDLIEARPYDAAYARLIARDASQLGRMAWNKRADEVWQLFGDLSNRIMSPHWEVYSLMSNYQSLIRNDGVGGQLVTCSLLQPSVFQGFRQTIIASALFTSSCVYQLWTAQGVRLRPVDPAMFSGLRYQKHGNGAHITVNYVTDRDWSKYLRDREPSDGNNAQQLSLRDQLPGLITSALQGESFAWMGNRDIPDDYFSGSAAVRLPNSPHGLNQFQHLHHVAVLSALNPPPAHFHFMETRGVNAEALRTAHYRSAVYQAVMRISIRDPEDTAPKTVIVMDQSTALWLAELFPGCRVAALNGAAVCIPAGKRGRPRVHASARDRDRAYRQRKQELKAARSGLQTPGDFGTAYASIYDRDPFMHLNAGTDEEFIRLLRELHARRLPGKHENFLLSPAHFDPDRAGVETRRGLDNIRHVRGVWLDNDGGDLTHAEFARLLPSLRIVAWNTFSSTRARPRWRCFIPTTEAVTPAVYQAIIAQIMQVLRYAGYVSDAERLKRPTLKTHGFDTGKFVASSLFYAPCQAAEPRASFFHDYDEAGRTAIDPGLWIDRDIRDPAPESRDPRPQRETAKSGENTQAIQQATDRWRSTPRGQGNRAFYRFGQELSWAGLNPQAIRTRLLAEARNSASPRDRTADAKRMFRQLKK